MGYVVTTGGDLVQRWEYQVLRLPHDRQRGEKIGGEQVYHVEQDEAILNALGTQGWEVVAATGPGPGHDAVLLVILKRPAPSSGDSGG